MDKEDTHLRIKTPMKVISNSDYELARESILGLITRITRAIGNRYKYIFLQFGFPVNNS